MRERERSSSAEWKGGERGLQNNRRQRVCVWKAEALTPEALPLQLIYPTAFVPPLQK